MRQHLITNCHIDNLNDSLFCLQNLLKYNLYVLYIEEAFKFIPSHQFIFTTMAEYSQNEVSL